MNEVSPIELRKLVTCSRALIDKHKGITEDVEGTRITDRALLERWEPDIQIADAIYERTLEK